MRYIVIVKDKYHESVLAACWDGLESKDRDYAALR